MVDADQVDILAETPWYAGKRGYATSRSGQKLHRRVIKAVLPDWVDHKSRDKMDCRRSNLRICNPTESIRNRSRLKLKKPGKNPSKFKGITCQSGGWVARIGVDGKRIYLGVFPSEEAAAKAYDEAATLHHGAFAALNFGEERRSQLERRLDSEPPA